MMDVIREVLSEDPAHVTLGIQRLHEALRKFNSLPYSADTRRGLNECGIHIGSLLSLMSTNAKDVPVDSSLVAEAVTKLTKDKLVRDDLVFKYTNEMSSEGHERLSVVLMACDHKGSTKLADAVAENFIEDLISRSNGIFSDRIIEILETLLTHPELSVHAALARSVRAMPVDTVKIFSEIEPLHKLVTKQIVDAAAMVSKGKKGSTLAVEAATRNASMFLDIYIQFEDADRLKPILSGLWELAETPDALTILSVLVMFQECGSKEFFRKMCYTRPDIDKKLCKIVDDAGVMKNIIAPDAFRILAEVINYDPGSFNPNGEGWKEYIEFVQNSSTVVPHAYPDWESTWRLTIELLGRMCQDSDEKTIGIVMKHMPNILDLTLAPLETPNIPNDLILATFHSWSLVLLVSNPSRTKRDVYRFKLNEKDEPNRTAMFDYGINKIFPRVLDICLRLPFETIRQNALRCLESFLSFEEAMVHMLSKKEFLLLLRMSTTQPVMQARHEFICSLLRIYSAEHIKLHLADKLAYDHFVEMKDNGYAYIVPSIRNEPQVDTLTK